jgi:hypothetical protein
MPFPWSMSFLVELPERLVLWRGQLVRLVGLELDGVSPGFLCRVYETFSTVDGAPVIPRKLRDEIRRKRSRNCSSGDLNIG